MFEMSLISFDFLFNNHLAYEVKYVSRFTEQG